MRMQLRARSHILLLLFGFVLVGLGVLLGRNSQMLSGRVRGNWISPRTVEARDGVVVLMGVFCVVIGVGWVCVTIAHML
jgi:hypothetical protein